MAESETERKELQAVLDEEARRLCALLGLDSLQIVATTVEADGTTTRYPAGHGNWHARMGSLRQTLVIDDEDTRQWVKRRSESDS